MIWKEKEKKNLLEYACMHGQSRVAAGVVENMHVCDGTIAI